MENNLFYSPKEGIAFLIAGYDDSTDVNDLINILEEGKKHFDRVVGTVEGLRTRVIQKSSRYKHMRVYWCEDIDLCPEFAFVVGGGDYAWTMNEWIKN